jgi:hypothetical protein
MFTHRWFNLFLAITLLALSVLASMAFTVHPVEAAGLCPAPGTGLPGALNMLHDGTMVTIPMAHDAAQGNTGMFIAVGNSGC